MIPSSRNNPGIIPFSRNNPGITPFSQNNQRVIPFPRNKQAIISSPRNNQGIIPSSQTNQGIIPFPQKQRICPALPYLANFVEPPCPMKELRGPIKSTHLHPLSISVPARVSLSSIGQLVSTGSTINVPWPMIPLFVSHLEQASTADWWIQGTPHGSVGAGGKRPCWLSRREEDSGSQEYLGSWCGRISDHIRGRKSRGSFFVQVQTVS